MGILLSLFFYKIVSGPLERVLIVIFLLTGSLLPDIDEPKSFIGRYFKFLNSFFRHRGFFHSLLFVSLITIIITSINRFYGLAIFIGLLSHIILDALTKEGIKLPFRKKKLKGHIKVGSWKEKVLQSSIIILILIKIFFIF